MAMPLGASLLVLLLAGQVGGGVGIGAEIFAARVEEGATDLGLSG